MRNEFLVQALDSVSERLGVKLKWYHSQKHMDVSYGASQVQVGEVSGHTYHNRDCGSLPFAVEYVCEADHETWWEARESRSRRTATTVLGNDMADFLYDTLASGRTKLVGTGVNLDSYEDSLWLHCRGEVTVSWDVLYEANVLRSTNEYRSIHKLDMDVDYQRGHVWTKAQQSAFVGWALTGAPTPRVYLQRYDSVANASSKDYWNLPSEVIDGKQRITASWAFIAGDIPATMPNGDVLWYKDFHEGERYSPNMNWKIVYVDVTRSQRLDLYLKLNNAGVPHTEEELDRVRELLDVE